MDPTIFFRRRPFTRITSAKYARFLVSTALIAGLALLARGEGAVQPVPFSNPPIAESKGGVLDLTLTRARAEVTVAGHTVTTTVYNGLYVPPVLKVQPGDTIRVRLINAADNSQPTNIHYHGLGVSPRGNGDNVFLEINPGDPPFQYNVRLPLDHPQGLYWYHPHFHPDVNPQIAAGLSGGLIVGSAESEVKK